MDNQADSALAIRLRGASTATTRRATGWGTRGVSMLGDGGGDFEGCGAKEGEAGLVRLRRLADTSAGESEEGVGSAPRSMATASDAEAKRASGRRCRHRSSTPSQAGASSGTSSRGEGGDCRRRRSAVAIGVSATKGRRPVTISKSTTPKE
nr:hypothetical protein [Vitiosangium sp. GDMCC 1.1324]